MPSAAPAIAPGSATHLKRLGAGIRAQRRRHRVSAVNAAEAAGLSRVTLHRIERGEPSVTMGAYVNAAAALGLALELVEPGAPVKALPRAATTSPREPIRLRDYPQLARLAWQRAGADPATDDTLSPQEALSLYERHWRHVEQDRLDARERALINDLAATVGGGRLLV